MNLVECLCGTVYHFENDGKTNFRCSKCSRTVVVKKNNENTDPEASVHLSDSPHRLSKFIFYVGCMVGIFTLLSMIPTYFLMNNKELALDQRNLMIFLIIMELVMGTLLVCTTVSFYLLSLQVKTMQSTMSFHQHNLQIFADQISKIFQMIRRKD